jgi:hypothetical protein
MDMWAAPTPASKPELCERGPSKGSRTYVHDKAAEKLGIFTAHRDAIETKA